MRISTIYLGEMGTVEVCERRETSPDAFEYEVRLNGVRGRVFVVERNGVPIRAPSGQGWREVGSPTLSYEQLDAIAAAIITRDWRGGLGVDDARTRELLTLGRPVPLGE